MTKNKPIHECRLGAIRATIWSKDGAKGGFFTVTLSRLYRNGTDWKRSNSFAGRELENVAAVLSLARKWIDQQAPF